jgi:hypothetical protein
VEQPIQYLPVATRLRWTVDNLTKTVDNLTNRNA